MPDALSWQWSTSDRRGCQPIPLRSGDALASNAPASASRNGSLDRSSGSLAPLRSLSLRQAMVRAMIMPSGVLRRLDDHWPAERANWVLDRLVIKIGRLALDGNMKAIRLIFDILDGKPDRRPRS